MCEEVRRGSQAEAFLLSWSIMKTTDVRRPLCVLLRDFFGDEPVTAEDNPFMFVFSGVMVINLWSNDTISEFRALLAHVPSLVCVVPHSGVHLQQATFGDGGHNA